MAPANNQINTKGTDVPPNEISKKMTFMITFVNGSMTALIFSSTDEAIAIKG